MHTLESLAGVFDPSPPSSGGEEDDDEWVPPAHVHCEDEEDEGMVSPRGSVERTREWARTSIMEAAGLISGGNSNKRPREHDDSGSSSSEGEEEEEPPQQHQHQHQPAAAGGGGGGAQRCFLCDYCTSQEVRFVTTFIADNIANMDVGLMAEQIRRYIFDKRPEYRDGSHGLEVNIIRRHIREHMLSPTVRIADMMRHLLRLCDTLRGNLERVDPDTGESMADRSNIDTYLKVVTKVLDMYKMSETNKMLFANSEK